MVNLSVRRRLAMKVWSCEKITTYKITGAFLLLLLFWNLRLSHININDQTHSVLVKSNRAPTQKSYFFLFKIVFLDFVFNYKSSVSLFTFRSLRTTFCWSDLLSNLNKWKRNETHRTTLTNKQTNKHAVKTQCENLENKSFNFILLCGFDLWTILKMKCKQKHANTNKWQQNEENRPSLMLRNERGIIYSGRINFRAKKYCDRYVRSHRIFSLFFFFAKRKEGDAENKNTQNSNQMSSSFVKHSLNLHAWNTMMHFVLIKIWCEIG